MITPVIWMVRGAYASKALTAVVTYAGYTTMPAIMSVLFAQ